MTGRSGRCGKPGQTRARDTGGAHHQSFGIKSISSERPLVSFLPPSNLFRRGRRLSGENVDGSPSDIDPGDFAYTAEYA
jgi:hypothetical protein